MTNKVLALLWGLAVAVAVPAACATAQGSAADSGAENNSILGKYYFLGSDVPRMRSMEFTIIGITHGELLVKDYRISGIGVPLMTGSGGSVELTGETGRYYPDGPDGPWFFLAGGGGILIFKKVPGGWETHLKVSNPKVAPVPVLFTHQPLSAADTK